MTLFVIHNRFVVFNAKFPYKKNAMHSVSAPAQRSQTVEEKSAASALKGMKHPTSSHGITIYDFFLFGYIKGRLRPSQLIEEDGLSSTIDIIFKQISEDLLCRLFCNWEKRGRLCNASGAYFD
jgi:hypothetical protein